MPRGSGREREYGDFLMSSRRSASRPLNASSSGCAPRSSDCVPMPQFALRCHSAARLRSSAGDANPSMTIKPRLSRSAAACMVREGGCEIHGVCSQPAVPWVAPLPWRSLRGSGHSGPCVSFRADLFAIQWRPGGTVHHPHTCHTRWCCRRVVRLASKGRYGRTVVRRWRLQPCGGG